MDSHVRAAALFCTDESDAERISFPQVVAKLMAAGFERYHTDLIRAEKTYFLPNGDSVVTPIKPVSVSAAMEFDAAGVEAAVRAIQQGQITYADFCARIMKAGCTDYLVSLAGKRAVYRGRTGDSHTEWFPGSK